MGDSEKLYTGAQMVMEAFLREGVDTIFGYPGGANLPLYDVLEEGGVGIRPVPEGIEPKRYPIKHYLVKHEQAAAHAADAYARIKGTAGVCYGTSGPGATNLVTGIANAFMDSIPLVCVTGQVISPLIGRDGFQEADIVGITIPITKHNELVMDVNRIPAAMQEAFHIATTGRPGPVLVDIPRDVLQQTGKFYWADKVQLRGYRTNGTHVDRNELQKAIDLIQEAEKPVIIAGHGVIIGNAYDELLEFAEKTQHPGHHDAARHQRLPWHAPALHGDAGYARHVLEQPRDQRGRPPDRRRHAVRRPRHRAPQGLRAARPRSSTWRSTRPRSARTCGRRRPLQGDVKVTLRELNKVLPPGKPLREWREWIDDMRAKHPSILIRETDEVLPQYVIDTIYRATKGDCYVVTGVGQHQMWAAQYFWYDKPNSFITSGGLGTMGFEVPAAMGAQVAAPNDDVWSICGDGGFQMTLAGAGDDRRVRLADQVRDHQQQQPGHGAAVAGAVLQEQHRRHAAQEPRLREARGGVRYAGPARREEGAGRGRHPGGDGRTRARSSSTSRCEYAENVYPMVPPGASLDETIDAPKWEMVEA